jgi:hypothetical protein
MMDTGIAIRAADITGTKVRSHLCLAALPGRDDGYAAAGCALMARSMPSNLAYAVSVSASIIPSQRRAGVEWMATDAQSARRGQSGHFISTDPGGWNTHHPSTTIHSPTL